MASLSACHMLWYLHLCADSGITVTSYADDAHGSVEQTPDGGGQFTDVTLHPVVRIGAGGDSALAASLHERAHALCFIARSVNFPVRCEPRIEVETR